MKHKHFIYLFICIVIMTGGLIGWKNSASASATDDECVPSEAYTETIEHPLESHTVYHAEVTEVIHHPEVTEEVTVIDQAGVEEVWANFSPNQSRDPFVGPPTYPSDPRGTWQVHSNIPGGHEGPDGVYFKGNPHKGGDWFYRQVAVAEVTHTETVVTEEAYDETVVVREAWIEHVVDQEAWTEIIEHPAVTCDEDPDPTDPPVVEPEDPEPATRVTVECISQTEIKVTQQEFIKGEGWTDTKVTFEPATKKDHCKVGKPGEELTPDQVDQLAGEVYASEEGM
jgi:hypothetical protein